MSVQVLLIIWKCSPLFSEIGGLEGFEMFPSPAFSLFSFFFLHCRLHNQLLRRGCCEERNRLHNRWFAGQDLLSHRPGQVRWLGCPCWDTSPPEKNQVGWQRLSFHWGRWDGTQRDKWADVKSGAVVRWKRCFPIFCRGPEVAHRAIESLTFFMHPLPSRSS